MQTAAFSLIAEKHARGDSLIWRRGSQKVLALPRAAIVEIAGSKAPTVQGDRYAAPYDRTSRTGDSIEGTADVNIGRSVFRLNDLWKRISDDTWRVDRRLEAVTLSSHVGVRLLLELSPLLPARLYTDFRYFAPPALTDLNDLDEDGIEDYLETRSLHFREDRLNLLALLAYSDTAKLGFSLARADRPEHDPLPDRPTGHSAFVHATDIGSLGIEPKDDGVALVAAYPFAERTRSHALLVRERAPFAAFAPTSEGVVIEASWLVRLVAARDAHDALWSLWTRRCDELAPAPVELSASVDEIAAARIDASLDYFIEEVDAPLAAGFVTNCHPQDGRQISNIIQFGFTGQNNLNALNLLRAADMAGDSERRRKAIKTLDFFAATAGGNRHGLIPGYYNADTRTFGSWWTGLILPLAYADRDSDLEALMGPIYAHLMPVIEALGAREGIYLRCVVEEYDALLAAFRHESTQGRHHPEWLDRARTFGDFLVGAQNPDGSWFRAYAPDGTAIVEPASWFGGTEVQQKSSTAVPIAFLVGLHGLTGNTHYLTAALRAGAFARARFVDGMRHNGGIHDSIYARPQLVDGESIMFCMRAFVDLHRATGEAEWLTSAVRAARMVVTWVCLWDIPLPEGSTLAQHGFRSTGWMACDAPGAGYIHPMGLLAVPDLVEVGLLAGEQRLLDAAALLQAGCNETVEMPGRTWGYARFGLQEEGLLVSWWFADDPMFTETAFGGRGKGEGNKTCLPWIAAVGSYACHELLSRHGTTDIAAIKQRHPDRWSSVTTR